MNNTRVWLWKMYGISLPFNVTDCPTQSDMVEYNQCQATLKTLYELGIPGKVEEFTAYRILMLLHGRNTSGTRVSFTFPDPENSCHHRIESLCRSANGQTESGSVRQTCTRRPAVVGHGKLSQIVFIVHRRSKYGRLYYGSFH